jgi:hypothetical protein
MDGFDPGAANTSVTRALGIADGVRRRFAAGIPGPNCMAAVTDRVDGGRQLHEGVSLHEGEHPSGRDGGDSSAHHRRCCPRTPVRRRDILQGHRRPAVSGVSSRATAGCGARPPRAAAAAAD